MCNVQQYEKLGKDSEQGQIKHPYASLSTGQDKEEAPYLKPTPRSNRVTQSHLETTRTHPECARDLSDFGVYLTTEDGGILKTDHTQYQEPEEFILQPTRTARTLLPVPDSQPEHIYEDLDRVESRKVYLWDMQLSLV